MEWIRSHPYTSTLTLSAIIIILGIVLVHNRSTHPALVGVTAWNGNPGVTDSSVTPVSPIVNTHIVSTGPQGPQYATSTLPYTPNTPVSTSEGTIQDTGTDSSFDYDALLRQVSYKKPTTANGGSTSSPNTIDSWGLIPSGLISASSRQSGRTALQQSLFDYGNAVGSFIQEYDAQHRNQVQVLSDASKDRQNTTKRVSLEYIGYDMQKIGERINGIDNVPSVVLSPHTTLSKAYIDMGKKLILMADALPERDPDLVKAILTYDSSVDTYTKDYVALALLFQTYGVTFASTDSGSVFTFSQSSL